TAIVISVLEVGVEPPNVRRPVYAGSHESGEDTAIIGAPVNGATAPFAMFGESRTPSNPLRLSSGPLLSPDAIDTAPQPLAAAPSRKRNRLFYPTLALLLIIIMATVAGTYFYFHRENGAALTQSLQKAQAYLTTANG